MGPVRPDGGGASTDSSSSSDGNPGERQSGKAAFVAALQVKRNALWGGVIGVGFTVLTFVLFVVLPGTTRSSLWFVGLAFVLALSISGLVAFLLTLGRAIRLSREL